MKLELKKYSSLDALKTPTVGEIFPRYSKVILNGIPANFQIAKRILVDFDRDMNIGELWKLHDQLMDKFKETRSMIDKEKLDIHELDIPRFSLMDLKMKIAEDLMKSCNLCEHGCRINRTEGEIGRCGVRGVGKLSIASEGIHTGEEPYISPSHMIFLMGCNLNCQYCQNWAISQWSSGSVLMPPQFLAKSIEKRSSQGARNVNWVGGEPTPYLYSILNVLKISEINSPQIWNSNFYMSSETMKLLDGVIDMYLSDFKYGNNDCASVFSKVRNYFENVSRNHSIAASQSELTIRHLILPEHIECCTKPILKWVSKNIRNKTIVNIMGQYRPEYNALEYPSIGRKITGEELKEVLDYAERLKLFFIS